MRIWPTKLWKFNSVLVKYRRNCYSKLCKQMSRKYPCEFVIIITNVVVHREKFMYVKLQNTNI